MNKGKLEFWLNVVAYYNKDIPDRVIDLYVHDSINVSLKDLRMAFEKYRNTSQGNFFPLPAQLKLIINPPSDPLDDANEIVARIFRAIRKFGYPNPDEAKHHIGELGWAVVQGMGGWSHLCTSSDLGYQSSVRAQLRDLAKSKLSRIERGEYETVPGKKEWDKVSKINKKIVKIVRSMTKNKEV